MACPLLLPPWPPLVKSQGFHRRGILHIAQSSGLTHVSSPVVGLLQRVLYCHSSMLRCAPEMTPTSRRRHSPVDLAEPGWRHPSRERHDEKSFGEGCCSGSGDSPASCGSAQESDTRVVYALSEAQARVRIVRWIATNCATSSYTGPDTAAQDEIIRSSLACPRSGKLQVWHRAPGKQVSARRRHPACPSRGAVDTRAVSRDTGVRIHLAVDLGN
jgi:hypothetical protein